MLVEKDCARCGDLFSYEHKKGRPRSLCDSCRGNHAPRDTTVSVVPNDFHVQLNSQDREKLQVVIDNLGTGRVEAIRTSIRVYHAILTQRR